MSFTELPASNIFSPRAHVLQKPNIWFHIFIFNDSTDIDFTHHADGDIALNSDILDRAYTLGY